MIKNIQELNQEELKELYKVLIDYYSDYNKDSSSFQLAKEMIAKFRAPKLARELLERVMFSDYIFLVSMNEAIDGFIMGTLAPDYKMGSINKIYVKDIGLREKRALILELYQKLIEEFQKMGVESIVSTSSTKNHDFINSLETIGLDITFADDKKIDYEKQL